MKRIIFPLILRIYSSIAFAVELLKNALEKVKALQELVTAFDKDKSFYMSSKYKEADVRRDFIDKMFEILGWDINND